jgi:16S rRNA (guanine966-N2)-methyltransferase
MRIIGGEFRSRVLIAPRGTETRPTSDRLRETLFNVIQPRLAGARFLDLYAGSGANGLEALSRGAAQAVFVEQASTALAAIRANVTSLGVGGRAQVEGVPVRRWLANAVRTPENGTMSPIVPAFHVIFLDPPYTDTEEYRAVLEHLGSEGARLVVPGGVVIAEHRRDREGNYAKQRNTPVPAVLAQSYGLLRRKRTLEQGDAALSFYVV